MIMSLHHKTALDKNNLQYDIIHDFFGFDYEQ